MGFLGKIFGAKPDMEKLRRALAQANYVEALHLGEDLQAAGETAEELEGLLVEAADGLARLNLAEGERLLAAGDSQRALEHLQLAREHARSAALQQQVEAAANGDAGREEHVREAQNGQPKSSCGTCAPAAHAVEELGEMPDEESHFELLLASYPEEIQRRYLASSDIFKRAVMLVHEGRDDAAQELLEALGEEAQDTLYRFELGSLYARQGQMEKARRLLAQVLAEEPDNLMALDALLAVQEDRNAASALLEEQLTKGVAPAYCQARLCELRVLQEDYPGALELARKALAGGYAAPEFVVMAAGLLEEDGAVDEAEKLLVGLPGGGCGGGVNLHLAEFWLRQQRELARVLDAFNGACRQEPENPRWQLRVAQTYLARNWRKQGVELLRRVVGDPRLEDHLRLEAEQLLAGG